MHIQDALLDEEGADDFGGGANAVSLKVPAAQARQEERMQSAQEAHEACHCSIPSSNQQFDAAFSSIPRSLFSFFWTQQPAKEAAHPFFGSPPCSRSLHCMTMAHAGRHGTLTEK